MKYPAFLILLTLVPLAAGDDPPPDPYAKRLAKASDDGLKAIKRIQVPQGLKVDLFAAEPHLANPVAFCIDEKGRFYVAETFRHSHGATDNRSHMYWLDDELAARTVADRIALYKKYKHYDKWGKEHDRVRLIEDTDGDGKADKATVFADGFNNPEDGIGAGLIVRQGKVWYTCIPHLWLLQDTRGTGRADVKKSLHHGYGVHVAFIGHDLHGLCFGPDGKLYFSIGDRGLHVETQGRTVSFPDGGAVLRCNPDGSDLEIVATGLRNPQELAFDKYGNLFTGDNNADGGDQARWVYIVEGGDSGWRIGYQYMKSLGPWNAEKMWHPHHEGQPAHLVPPLVNMGNGPSGLCYEPGASLLPDKYRDHFFLVDFRGGSGGSGIHSFALKPRGAAFEVVDRQQFVWSILATDCDFGPDGGFYVLDWVEGWNITNKGRIYKVFDPDRVQDPAVQEVKKLLAEGMDRRSAAELARLLQHKDMRIRQEAQFALAAQAAITELDKAALSGNQLARLHAIWGLGQVARKNPDAVKNLIPLLEDKDAEVRAQTAKVLGEARVAAALDRLLPRLKDAEPRVRFFAALALGKLGKSEAVSPILDMVRSNADQDAYLRHAGVMGLTGIADKKALQKAADDPAPSVRLASLLAQRRLALPEVARFLTDVDPKLVVEAARAIYDTPIPEAMPHLAAILQKPVPALALMPPALKEQFYLRVLNAHFRLGQKENAQALAEFAAKSGGSDTMRLEALAQLDQWQKPSGRDRVVGLWRPLEPRPAADVAAALRPALAGLMTSSPKISSTAASLAGKYGIKEIAALLRELVTDKSRPPSTRIQSFRALETLQDSDLVQVAQIAIRDDEPRLRHEARRVLTQNSTPEQALQQLASVLKTGSVAEKQGALTLLADKRFFLEADELLITWMMLLKDGKVPPEIQLDLLEAARNRPLIKPVVTKYETSLPKDDPLALYRVALAGGDADNGRRIFLEKSELSCLRCHKVNGNGGDVGPDLTGIGKKQKREYLLEALVDPNRQIAKGYETVVLTLTNGQVKTGILRHEDAKEVRLVNAEGQILVIAKDQIEERNRGPSAMPADLVQKMSRSELRDLVEFLAGLQ